MKIAKQAKGKKTWSRLFPIGLPLAVAFYFWAIIGQADRILLMKEQNDVTTGFSGWDEKGLKLYNDQKSLLSDAASVGITMLVNKRGVINKKNVTVKKHTISNNPFWWSQMDG